MTVINRFVSQEEAAIYFSAVDATVLPYTSATQSGVLALGYYYETPLVVTNHPGLSQPIKEDKTGVICPAKVVEIQKAITAVTETKANQEFRHNLNQTKQRYSWANYAQEWAKFVLDETT
jgi:glycosyltransferase involved in cell wall biosynthesis